MRRGKRDSVSWIGWRRRGRVDVVQEKEEDDEEQEWEIVVEEPKVNVS